MTFAHLLGEFNQFRDDLRGFDGAVLVAADGGFQHFGKRTGLNEIFLRSDFPSPQRLGRLEPLGKRRKEFGGAERPQRAERVGASESMWPQAG